MPTPFNPENFTRTRNPKCAIAFLTEQEIIVDSEQIVSVETSKSLGEPAGTFRILLKPNSLVGTKNNTSNPADITPQGSTVSPGVPDTQIDWLTHLRPMTLVQIAFTERNFPADLKFTQVTNGRASLDLDAVEITMLGVIDSVSMTKQITAGGPQRYIQILGRDMGRAFMDDTHFVFPFPFNDAPDPKDGSLSTDQKRGLAYYLNGTPEQQKEAVGRYFFAGTKDSDGNDIPSWRTAYLTGNVGDIIFAIHDNAPGINVQLANGSNLKDYLPLPLLDNDIASIPFIGAKLMLSSGSVWSLLQEVVPNPFGEMFVDTVGNSARLIIRRPPWGRPFREQTEQIDKLARTYVDARSNTVSTANPNPVADYLRNKGTLWDTDEVTNTDCRVIPGQKFHDIFDEDTLELNLGKSDREVVNLFFTKASANWAGDETSPIMSAALVTPMLDILSIGRYGLRMYSPEDSWWNPRSPLKGDGTSDEAPGKNILAELLLDNLRLYFWFRDNDSMLSGQMVIRGRPEVRIGDYVRLPAEGLVFYVEAVNNRWVYGQPFITTLSLSRGQLETPVYLKAGINPGDLPAGRTFVTIQYGRDNIAKMVP